MDYKETLNLPTTGFPMRANLPQNEPKQVEIWRSENTYFKILDANKAGVRFVLHDGPPYANGNIHIGHALNKILKDIIVKYKAMTGHAAPYVPGWDCHGLPIELQVEKNIGRAKKLALSKVEIRRLCKEYAEKYIAIQRQEFTRLGVLGDWHRPYRTLDPAYEAQEVRELGKFVASGTLYRKKKPVYWCTSCVTALAEAEVEYEDHTSPSIYVKFPVVDDNGKLGIGRETENSKPETVHFVIWTTTPWTLPANQAIAVHPRFVYCLVRTPAGALVLNRELVETVMKVVGFGPGEYEVASGSWTGAELENIICRHPWIERDSRVILGEFVTQDQGTGAVHIAPGHGQEDYEAGINYGLEVLAPVDAEGKFTRDAGELEGESVLKADGRIIALLAARGMLLKEERLTHSYPHCWRCKKPVIFRATEQWFISMEKGGLREAALRAIEDVRWIPPWGKDRIGGMLESRPDWCISRQRSWGVPIPAVYCRKCNEALLTEELCAHVAAIFEREGSDAWFTRTIDQLVPEDFQCPRCHERDFYREEDILDVWFDSGVSHAAVVERDARLGGRADMYLEGSDQHRGWFHTALLTAVATRGRPPYDSVLTHGFTLDGRGRKMSKSLGNTIAPQDIIKKHGAEILRLWVAAEDYREDVRISDEIINRLVEAYRRLRNTARFLISNLYDFDPSVDAVARDALDELDRWILHRTQVVLSRCREAYEKYEFHVVFHSLNNFCAVDLSALYLDIVKDRLYCEGKRSIKRRAAQTALHRILSTLVGLMAPVLSFTAEEVWSYLPSSGSKAESVFLSSMPEPDPDYIDKPLAERWDKLFKERAEVLKALEEARAKGIIGHSLDARVTLVQRNEASVAMMPELIQSDPVRSQDVLIVSQAELSNNGLGGSDRELALYDSDLLGCPIAVTKARGAKCERCWKYDEDVGKSTDHPNVCPRCAAVLASGAEG
jgi:isoleucyl-tRNA synthetase